MVCEGRGRAVCVLIFPSLFPGMFEGLMVHYLWCIQRSIFWPEKHPFNVISPIMGPCTLLCATKMPAAFSCSITHSHTHTHTHTHTHKHHFNVSISYDNNETLLLFCGFQCLSFLPINHNLSRRENSSS